MFKELFVSRKFFPVIFRDVFISVKDLSNIER